MKKPDRGARSACRSSGFRSSADPAVPRHLSQFLRRHRAEAIAARSSRRWPAIGPPRPDAILFNGGALTPDSVRRRIVEVITSWFADLPGTSRYAPRVLTNISLDLAVAQGAAYYGVVRRGGGIRIGGGTARSFYVGLETGASEKPWLCVVPRDAQEGEEIAIAGHDFDLLMGQPVMFPLASSSVRPDDKPGELVRADPDSIRELPPLQSLMQCQPQSQGRASAGQPGGAGDRGRHDRALVPVAHRRPPLAAPDPASRAGRTAQGAVEITGDESDHVVIEQSELDAAIAAIRAAFDDRPAAGHGSPAPRCATPDRRGWSSGSRRSSTSRATSGRPRRCGRSGNRCSQRPRNG